MVTSPGAAAWVRSGPGLPCGALVLGDAPDDRIWLDVCIIGQHLPQMYRADELRELTADGCAELGLCPACLGFGDTSRALPAGLLEASRGIDEVERPCPACGGSGRPALRVTLTRNSSGVTGEIRPLPHQYVGPVTGADDARLLAAFGIPEGWCMACGMPADGTGPRGEALHPAGQATDAPS